MAIIAGTTVNWRLSPRVITIPVAETSITVEDLQDTLLDLEAQETDGILFPHLRNTSGGENLGGGVSVGWTMELQDAVVAFAPRTTCSESGTATTADAGGTKLIDSTALFITNGVLPGATIVNFPDQSVTSVISVDSETQLTHYALLDGTDNDWDIGDAYKVWNEIQTEITGGNTVAVNGVGAAISPIRPTFGTQVLKTSSSSATQQEQLDIQQSAFSGMVIVDAGNVTGNALAGTAFPAGTERQPCLTLADAVSVANSRGIGTIGVEGVLTVGAAESLNAFTLRGLSTITTNIITVTAGATTVNTRFEDCTVLGTLNGRINATEVIFGAIIDMAYDSWLKDVWFEGDVTLTGGGTFFCANAGPGLTPGATERPNFDYTNVTTARSNFLRWSGHIGFKNVTSGNISLNVDSGKVFIDSTNTGGNLFVQGSDVVVSGTSGGMTVTSGQSGITGEDHLTLPQFLGLK